MRLCNNIRNGKRVPVTIRLRPEALTRQARPLSSTCYGGIFLAGLGALLVYFLLFSGRFHPTMRRSPQELGLDPPESLRSTTSIERTVNVFTLGTFKKVRIVSGRRRRH